MKRFIKPLVILSISAVLLGVAVYLHSIDHPTITPIKFNVSQTFLKKYSTFLRLINKFNVSQNISQHLIIINTSSGPLLIISPSSGPIYPTIINPITIIYPHHSTPSQIPPPWYATLWPIFLAGSIIGFLYLGLVYKRFIIGFLKR